MSKTKKISVRPDKKIIRNYDFLYNKATNLRNDFNDMLRTCVKNVNCFAQQSINQEYLFNKPTHVVLSLNELTDKKKYRRIIKPLIMKPDQKEYVISELKQLWKNEKELYEKYTVLRNKCKSCRKYYSKNYKILKKASQHPLGINKSSEAEEKTLDCLHELFNQYQLYYFYSHKFNFCRNNILYVLEFDFYCFMIHDNRLIQFVIEIDGEHHVTGGFSRRKDDENNSQHVRDIMKQYYLSQLNIHLIRINKFENIKNQIIEFIDEIISSSKYVITNPIKIQDIYFKSKVNHDGLQLFNNYFSKYRTLYLDSLDEDGNIYRCDSGNVLDDYNPGGIDYVVSADEFQKFMKEKYCY